MVVGVKINLSLRVGPRRADGYHELATVLAALPLGDSLELEPAASTRVEAPGLAGGDALVTRALGLLAARAGHAAGWRVHIDKHAPVGAGIGGGSADAGAALRLANATLPEPLAADELLALAAEVGSDVPFFASGLDAALARGRGELLEPCALRRARLGRARLAGRRARHGRGVRALPAGRPARGSASRSCRPRRSRLPTAGSWPHSSRTTSARPPRQLCPPTAALREQLLACGALAACVSGSGSARLRAVRRGGRGAGRRRAGRAPRALDARHPPVAGRRWR